MLRMSPLGIHVSLHNELEGGVHVAAGLFRRSCLLDVYKKSAAVWVRAGWPVEGLEHTRVIRTRMALGSTACPRNAP